LTPFGFPSARWQPRYISHCEPQYLSSFKATTPARKGNDEVSEAHDAIVIEEVGTITRTAVNRPTKKNALTTAMDGRLAAALRDANDDSNIGVVVLTGTGRPFTAGNEIAPPGRFFDKLPWRAL
jgi:hypothetical protein